MQCVGTDIFEYRGVYYLIVVDYSLHTHGYVLSRRFLQNQPLVHSRQYSLSLVIHNACIQMQDLSTHQMGSKQICATNDISHTTSFPHYHESNGLAKRYVGIVKTIMKKNPEMINDSLLAYRAAPRTNNEYSHAELMFKRNVKAHMISLPVHFPTDDRSPENVNAIEQKENHPKLYPDDRVFKYDIEKKLGNVAS